MAVLVYLAWSIGCLWWLMAGGQVHLWWLFVFVVLLVNACIRSPMSTQDSWRWIMWRHRHHRRHDWW